MAINLLKHPKVLKLFARLHPNPTEPSSGRFTVTLQVLVPGRVRRDVHVPNLVAKGFGGRKLKVCLCVWAEGKRVSLTLIGESMNQYTLTQSGVSVSECVTCNGRRYPASTGPGWLL